MKVLSANYDTCDRMTGGSVMEEVASHVHYNGVLGGNSTLVFDGQVICRFYQLAIMI